ncbi:hypothetical protein PLANPX_1941 [Lacipirellula parvula]|uniref:Uncharacterized protein n=1 Tax=Lacipirellula parvula TaxID=2650471 RepID=A0A5K7XH95_9BACT|nr:hypothetical protein PLANPX_1941 [Lacipirellula parvula]
MLLAGHFSEWEKSHCLLFGQWGRASNFSMGCCGIGTLAEST